MTVSGRTLYIYVVGTGTVAPDRRVASRVPGRRVLSANENTARTPGGPGSRERDTHTRDEHRVALGTSTQSQTANPTSTKPTHTQTGPHIRDSTHRLTGKHTSTRKTYQYQSVRPKLQSPAVPRTQTTYFHQLNEELSSNENVHNALKLAWATWHTQ